MSENEIQTTADETVAETKTEVTETAAKADETVAETPKIAESAAPTEEPKAAEAPKEEEPVPPEEISYHAVEKDDEITAIWEMQGQKHLRTIDPRSGEGQKIFSLFTSEIHDTDAGASEEASA